MVASATGLARKVKDTRATTMAIATAAISTGMIGGRVHLALSISSVIGVWPALGCGADGTGRCPDCGGGAGVGTSGIGLLLGGAYSCAMVQDYRVTFLHSRFFSSMRGRISNFCQYFSAPAHNFGELRGRQRVQHVGLGKPCAAELEHAIADFFQVRSVMRIGVDHELHALGLGHAQMLVAQLQAL